jgi:23S rRNA G2445 N2-methylase RlmL
MIPALARKLIDTYVPESGSVLDPFCGGGAVLVEAIRSGREAAGRDVNDLAVLLSTAKTTHVDADQIMSTGKEVMERARQYSGPPMRFPASEYVAYWFKDYMFEPLTALKVSVEDIQSTELRLLFKVILSGTVRSVSLTYRNEVRLRRMNAEKQARFNPDVFQTFAKYVDFAHERVPQLPAGAKADVRKEDVRHSELTNNSFDAVICSPPYGDERNGVNYTQFGKNMLRWLGYGRTDIQASKQLSLGWGKAHRTIPPSKSLVEALNVIQENPTAFREAVAYYADYFEALRQLASVAKSRIIIVIGNRVLHKRILNNPQITAELMAAIGVQLETIHFRKLPTKRLPKMREFGAAIDREAILVFHK